MTVPIIDADKVEKEGQVVIPTAYAMYETSANTLVSIGITPGILLERIILDGNYKGENLEHLFDFPYSTFKASIDNYNTHYLIGEYAYEYHPEYLPALFGDRIPILGNFLPGPTGPQGQEATQWWYFGGIADKKPYEISRDRLTEQYYKANGVDVQASQYDHGSAMEVLAAGIFGFNARGVEALGKLIDFNRNSPNLIEGLTINAAAHSGGGMIVLQASRYAGYLGASFNDVSVVQSPVIGYYANVQEPHLYESFAPSKKEVTSILGAIFSPFVFTNQGPIVMGDLQVKWEGDESIHLQTGDIEYGKNKWDILQIGNYFDRTVLKNLQSQPNTNSKK
jgi:hypothetical protein